MYPILMSPGSQFPPISLKRRRVSLTIAYPPLSISDLTDTNTHFLNNSPARLTDTGVSFVTQSVLSPMWLLNVVPSVSLIGESRTVSHTVCIILDLVKRSQGFGREKSGGHLPALQYSNQLTAVHTCYLNAVSFI